ncbi:MAG: hypothetical protein OEZ32_02580 [Nitrospinota bacterium]|nr:hypothetical protein [Nitrospinota bacterium]
MRLFLIMITAVAVASTIPMAGCATPSAGIDHPSVISKQKLGAVKSGASQEDVVLALGEPESRLVADDGETLFFKDVNLDSVWVQFGKDGKVTSWKWSE